MGDRRPLAQHLVQAAQGVGDQRRRGRPIGRQIDQRDIGVRGIGGTGLAKHRPGRRVGQVEDEAVVPDFGHPLSGHPGG